MIDEIISWWIHDYKLKRDKLISKVWVCLLWLPERRKEILEFLEPVIERLNEKACDDLITHIENQNILAVKDEYAWDYDYWIVKKENWYYQLWMLYTYKGEHKLRYSVDVFEKDHKKVFDWIPTRYVEITKDPLY